ncbi:MAG: hypothetical protein WD049_03345 [Candidatus Paceibacterota bacterium]
MIEKLSDVHLLLKLSFGLPVFEEMQLRSLHQMLITHLPNWSSGLTVAKREHDRKHCSVGPEESLAEAVNKVAPARRGIGNAVLAGRYDGLSFYMNSCSSTLPPELNGIGIEITGISAVEGKTPWSWAWSFLENAAVHFPLRYARACISEEFNAKNMVSDENGTRAIGVQLDDALPGIYWLNYFGSPYMKLIGRHRLLSVPAHDVREISDGVFMALDATPMGWASDGYKANERAVIEHIGWHYVFSRAEPDRKTVAPDFRADSEF